MAMLNKYKKTENRQTNDFVPSNTLLEPNNVIPSWECGGEEIKEVSKTMRVLRRDYDLVHRQVEAKEKEFEKLKRKLEQQQNEEVFIEDEVFI